MFIDFFFCFQIDPVETCEATIACESDESEICISSTIAEISQECVEQCETVMENVCENKMVQKCEDLSTTTCKMVQKCEQVPKVNDMILKLISRRILMPCPYLVETNFFHEIFLFKCDELASHF